jgi:hypothetical protein
MWHNLKYNPDINEMQVPPTGELTQRYRLGYPPIRPEDMVESTDSKLKAVVRTALPSKNAFYWRFSLRTERPSPADIWDS